MEKEVKGWFCRHGKDAAELDSTSSRRASRSCVQRRRWLRENRMFRHGAGAYNHYYGNSGFLKEDHDA